MTVGLPVVSRPEETYETLLDELRIEADRACPARRAGVELGEDSAVAERDCMLALPVEVMCQIEGDSGDCMAFNIS